jgi:predicted kinase
LTRASLQPPLPSPLRHVSAVRRVIAAAGPPCAGKSAVARFLSQSLDAPHLEMDQFRRRVLPGSDQRVEHRDIAYRAMHLTAELMVPRCGTVIVDATYTARECRLDLACMVDRVGASLLVVECHVEASAAVARFLRRNEHPAVDLTVGRVAALAADYPYFDRAYALNGRDEERVDLAESLRARRPIEMGPSQIPAWCEAGRPRGTR